ncbi:MAG: GYD domain-containing protein [Nitrososphaera sp.]
MILRIKLTDQGARNIKDSPEAQAAQEMAEKLGGKLTVYYTFGKYDIVCILEAPNDEV